MAPSSVEQRLFTSIEEGPLNTPHIDSVPLIVVGVREMKLVTNILACLLFCLSSLFLPLVSVSLVVTNWLHPPGLASPDNVLSCHVAIDLGAVHFVVHVAEVSVTLLPPCSAQCLPILVMTVGFMSP